MAEVLAHATSHSRAYLCVDAFVADMGGATALASAFETGVIDHLARNPGADVDSISSALSLNAPGLAVLLDMLRANGVISASLDAPALAPDFVEALKFRDLLEAKIHFAKSVAPDFLHLLTALLMQPDAFAAQARVFKLFSYGHALEATAENIERTARWMRLTTALTRYEAGACMDVHDFSVYRQMLDVGGNSGEFVLQLCRAHPNLQATVYDLPVVCDIGRAHIASESEAGRVGFVKVARLNPALPIGRDLICFKSMLHDWPHAEMLDFLRRAHEALAPGGTLLIFERTQLKLGGKQVAYGQLPLFLFFRSYRSADVYGDALHTLGLVSVNVVHVQLDMPFILITARKVGA